MGWKSVVIAVSICANAFALGPDLRSKAEALEQHVDNLTAISARFDGALGEIPLRSRFTNRSSVSILVPENIASSVGDAVNKYTYLLRTLDLMQTKQDSATLAKAISGMMTLERDTIQEKINTLENCKQYASPSIGRSIDQLIKELETVRVDILNCLPDA